MTNQVEIHNIVSFNLGNRLYFKKEGFYIICREGTKIFDEFFDNIDKYISSFFFSKKNSFMFLVNGINDKEPLILYYEPLGKSQKMFSDIMSKIIFKDIIVGSNAIESSTLNMRQLFLFLGFYKIPLDSFGIIDYNEYMDFIVTHNSKGRKYNRLKFERSYCYYCGSQNVKNVNDLSFESIYETKKDYIADVNILIVCKKIVGYGGNQKTSHQLIELLDRYYNINILSCAISNKHVKYDLSKDYLNNNIFNSYLIKKKYIPDIIQYINRSDYKFIINNKLNEFFDIVPKVYQKQPIYVITHNSMDPFNRQILENSKYLKKVFTINQRHGELLRINGLSCDTKKFYNYIPEQERIQNRYYFFKTLTFVGRISREKNVKLLIDSIIELCNEGLNIKLNIIGDGTDKNIQHENIIYYGKLEFNSIIKILEDSDYLVLPSYTEGIPFSVLESMSIGIPCIYSKINGSNEIISHGKTGFLFELKGYNDAKDIIDSWSVYDIVDKHYEENICNLKRCIFDAYSIPIDDWNQMSQRCYQSINSQYTKIYSFENNIKLF
tara:strand:+ start:939 stop:2591 length:1653 start_codon:yes stop_codon:yes gene_type:complete